MINVGFVGCGRIADLHVLGYQGNRDARLYAVCDPDEARRERRQRECGVEKAYVDHRTLLEDPKVDAIEVLCPYDLHERVVLEAIAAGKHVACQKPMTTSLASADRMLAAAKASAKIFKVTEIYVSYPPIALAKKLIAEGAIGEPMCMRINYISSPIGGWDVSAQTYEQQVRIASQGFGLETFDHGHHEWATAWWLLGEPERVSAWIDTLNGVVDAPSTVMWRCRDNKRYGVCDFAFCPELNIPTKYYSNDEIYQILGSKGVIMINRGTGEMMDRPPVSVFDGSKWMHYEDIEGDWAQGFVGATRNFVAAIQGREAPLLTGAEGREVLRFGLAVMKSAAQRREVFIDELEQACPAWYHWRRWRRERKDCVVRPQRRSWNFFAGRTAKFAPQAHTLTMQLPQRFDGAAAGSWECVIGLELIGEGGAPNQRFGLAVKQGKLEVSAGGLPKSADVTLRVRAGVWAAVLLGKKRIETAILQGLVKYEGHVEKALPLRNAFRI